MIRRTLLAIGLLASVLGLTIVVDSVFADDCGGSCCCNSCPHEQASIDTEACKTDVRVCAGQNQSGCDSTTNTFSFVKEDFPKSCVTAQGDTKCDEPLSNCDRSAQCIWDGGKCIDDDDFQGVWNSSKKRTTNPC